MGNTLDFDFGSRVKTGEKDVFEKWRIILTGCVAVATVPVLYMIVYNGYRPKEFLALIPPCLVVWLINRMSKTVPVYTPLKCRIEFGDWFLYYTIFGTETTNRMEYYFNYEKVDCIEVDPPSLSFRISVLPYKIWEYEKDTDELLLFDVEEKNENLDIYLTDKKEFDEMLYYLRRFIGGEIYVNGID